MQTHLIFKSIKETINFKYFVVLLSVMFLASCGGGGGGGGGAAGGSSGGNGGTQSAPKVLTFPGSFAYSGVMEANQGISYYKIVGMIADEKYQVAIITSSDIAYTAYSDSGYSSGTCLSSSATGTTCKANSNGELYLMAYSIEGPAVKSSYTLSVISKISEGTPSSPKDLTGLLPYTSSLPETNYKSLFVVTGLTAGNSYTIGLSEGSDTRVDLRVYQDQFQTEACSALTNVSAKSCTLTTAGTQLWMTAYGSGNYTLTVTDDGLPTTIYAPQGDLTTPVIMSYLADGLTGSGQVDDTDSYYIITGLKASTEYRVVLKNILSDNIDLSVYIDSSYSAASCVSEKTNLSNESCLVMADAIGSVWLRVTGANTVRYLGANFDVHTYEYFPNEGDFDNNIQLSYSAGLVYSGTVDSYSYYQINGLQVSTSYLVDLSNFSTLVSGTARSQNVSYSSEESPGLQRSHVMTDDTGVIGLRVKEGGYWDNGTAYVGTTFDLDVSLSPYQSEGTAALPVVLAPEVSYNAEIGVMNSYYRVDGLTAGTAYSINIAGMIVPQEFFVFDNASDLWSTDSAVCNISTTYNSSNTSCTRQAAGTSMWIKVVSNSARNGAALIIGVTASVYQAEGTSTAPVVLGFGTADLPHNGSTDTAESYYEIQGLSAATEYAISFNNVVASGSYASVYIYDDVTKLGSTVSGDYIGYTSASAGASGFSRVGSSGASLWVMVDGSDSGVGSFYELGAALSPVAENITIDAISNPLPLNRVSSTDQVRSDYTVTGLLPNQAYNVSISGLSADVDMTANGSYISDSACDLQTGNTDELCQVATDIDGELYIRVLGDKTLYGAFFDLKVTQGPSNEGSSAAPVVVTHDTVAGTTLRSSEVGLGISYYQITGLTAGRMYEVNLTGLTGDADLVIANDASFTSGSQCASNTAGEVNERCGGLADITGSLYVAVDSSYPSISSLFTLEIIDGLIPDGTITTGQAISYAGGLTTYSGQVDITNSYYVINGLDPKTSYTVTVSSMTDDVQLYVYTDSGYSAATCSSTLSGVADDACLATTPTGGAAGSATLYVKVAGALTVVGSTYTLQITP